jgi:hypothetical protein
MFWLQVEATSETQYRHLSNSKLFYVIFVKVFHFLARAQIQVFHKNETKNKVIRNT